jgi:hypothetical protein
MKFTPAIQECANLGWLFSIEDFTAKNGLPCSRIWLMRGQEKIFLSGLSDFIKMTKARFAMKLAALPVEREVQRAAS